MGKSKRASVLVFIASFIIYASISMTKSVYAASIASIIGEGLFTKSEAGIVNSGFYLLYGLGQLLGVKLMDKISPVKLIYFTLVGTIFFTFSMAFARSFEVMLILWSLCGLVQFAIWPATLRIISEYILPQYRDRAKTYISFSYCVGMLINYLIAAIVLEFFSWMVLFISASLIVLICLLFWYLVTKLCKKEFSEINLINNEMKLKTDNKKNVDAPDRLSNKAIFWSSGMILLLVPSFIRTAMDAGVKSWVPTLIVESYFVSESFASMLTTALVFINLSGVFIVNYFYPKYIKNSVLGFGLCFLLSVPFTLLLLMTGKINIFVAVMLLTLVTTLMYSGHQLINVIIPVSFSKYNKAGAVASLINAVASFGAVVANVLFGFLAENFGWSATILSWSILAFVAFVFCVPASIMWKKFNKTV